MKASRRILLALIIIIALSSCKSTGQKDEFRASTENKPENGDTDSNQVGDTSEDDSTFTHDSAPVGDDSDSDMDTGTGEICADWNVTVDNRPASVMLLEDVSASMVQDENLAQIPPPNKWSFAKDAITGLVTTMGDEIIFGLDIFSNAPSGEDACSVRNQALVDCDASNADEIISALNGIEPNGKTPLYLAMERFKDENHAPKFLSDDARPYLVIVSDGKDTCDPDGPDASGREDGATAFQLGDLTDELLRSFGIHTIVIGFGSGIDSNQLDSIAEKGGTEFTSYLVAQNADQLTDAFDRIAWSIIGCEYDLGEYDPQTVDFEKVNFLFDEKKVEQDVGCAEDDIGWTWANDDKTAVLFCSGACEMLKNHEVDDIGAVIGCPDIAPVK